MVFKVSVVKQLLAISSVAVAATACASGPSIGGLGGSGVNYASGSVLGAQLPDRDSAALEPIFVQAASRGGHGERFDWRGPDSFGWVKAQDHVLGNVKANPDERPVYPKSLYVDDRMETELGLYALTKNSNVRAGPSTDFPILETLPSGTGANGIGRVIGKPWILIEVDGRVVGYVHENLMVKAPGTELLLAGGPTRRPLKCRVFEQRISYTGRSDRWNGIACLEDGRWVLQATPDNQPVQLY